MAGLDSAALAALLGLRLRFCVPRFAQLADDGSADPSPLSEPSLLASRTMGCDEGAVGWACWTGA